MTAAPALPDIATVSTQDGKPFLDFSQFHEGQRRAYWSDARFTLVLAGTQGGKTACGPAWLLRQIAERGPGDYMVVAPNFPLMEKKALPEFLRLFETALRLGDYKLSPIRKFVFSPDGERRLFGAPQSTPTQLFFGYGEDPDTLESATIKACWVDEGGQRGFKRESWDALLRRLSIEQGPVLLTTTPYTLGWLSELHERADDPASGVRVINFPSIANPRFPRAEWERAQRELPPWKFNMFYRGLFERPAGMIYDCWDKDNVIPWQTIPDSWPRYLGMDFGGVNTAGMFIAAELDDAGTKTGRYIAYREYLAGGRTAAQHVAALRQGEPMLPTTIGGSKSEGQWRQEFAAAGLGIWEPPISDVELGILRLYGLIAAKRFLVMDTLTGFVDQVRDYSRVLDANGEPTEKIDNQNIYHYLDAGRYWAAFVAGGLDGGWVA